MTIVRRIRIRCRERDESGFTLAELIVAVVIETIIFTALATAFVVVLQGGSSVNESLKKSSDARLAAAYIVSDARNSSGPEISLTDTTSCADPSPPVAGAQTAVARFNWVATNIAGTTTANVSDYVLVAGSLVRRHCEGGVLQFDAVLASSVAAVTVGCAPVADCSGTPTSITVSITETPDNVGATPYAYSLTAAFRKMIGGGVPVAPSPPQSLVVFGKGGCGIDISGAAKMKVYGNAFVNSVDSGSCTALHLSNSGVWQAGATSILQGGSCSADSGLVCPTVTSYSPAITDPYSGLVAPTTSGLPSRSGCPSGTAQPGVYASMLTFGSSNCVLQPGIYILQAGFNLGNGAVVTTAAGGVMLYLTGGSFAVNGGASLTLTAMTSGTYSGISLWQAAVDTSTISFSNGGALIFNGTIYAPKAQLNISGNAQTPVAWSVVVQTVVLTNSGAISIGASPVPLSITAPASMPAWTVGRSYPSTAFTAAGGDTYYAWSATGLPTGLAINTVTGVVSGIPTATGTASVVVTLDDALGDDADTASFSVPISAAPAISTATLPSGEKTLVYSSTLASAGGTAPLAWSATGLPTGLTIDSASGTISGTPTATGSSTVAVTLTDAAGATARQSLTIVVGAPPEISSVTLANGTGTSGTIDAHDTVTVVFSAQMNVGEFCSRWSGDTSNHVLNALSDVTVTVTNGITDALTVTSATCTFNFGSINLASAAYVSVSATFKGSTTSTRSTIAWTASTHTLVITLGAKSAGTVANVSTSTPIYTASPVIADSAGALLSNSPFTLTVGKKF